VTYRRCAIRPMHGFLLRAIINDMLTRVIWRNGI
jgi:hypothetical protein